MFVVIGLQDCGDGSGGERTDQKPVIKSKIKKEQKKNTEHIMKLYRSRHIPSEKASKFDRCNVVRIFFSKFSNVRVDKKTKNK